GTSMGGMHTWLWGEQHPKYMDALMPLASLPTQISGRNRVWRRLIMDAIKNDPAWQGGEYHAQPPALRTAIEMIWLVGSNPPLRQQEAPTLVKADEVIDAPLLAVNSADDLVNPPELGILDQEIKRVPRGRAIVIPYSTETHGHGSHTYAVLWKQYLAELLRSPER